MGTLNEMIEAWTAAIDHKLTCPIVVIPYSYAFYKPFLDAIRTVAVDDRKLILTSDFNMIQQANDVNEAVRLVQQPMKPKAGTQFTLREKLIYLRHELGRGLTTVSLLPPAVIFMGSKCALSRTDAEVQFIIRLTKEILSTLTSIGIRLGVGGMIDEVVTESTEEEVASERIQRILMTDELPIEQEVHAHFESRSAYCESLLTNVKAAFFLPGDIPTLNVLFALVCEIQTGRRSRMPVFLIGAMFWQPIVDGLRETLKGGQYIKEKDIDIMTVIDTSEVDIISKVMKRI